jgi:DNA-binding PadR family transcriptional regulator
MKALTLHEEYILLSVLQLKDNAYLNTIRHHIKKTTGKSLALGTIYVPLDRLRRMGYVQTITGKPTPKVGGRSIKYYRITKQGLNALAEAKKVHDRMWLGFAEIK